MFERGTDATTRMLSGSSFGLEIRRSGSSRKALLLLLLLVCLAGYAYLSFKDEPAELKLRNEISALKLGNTALQSEVSQIKMTLAHERATRESLERDLAAQAEMLKQANRNLSFYRNQAGRPASSVQ